MSSATMRIHALIVLLSTTLVWAMQLPPDIQVDRYLVRA